MKQSQGFPRVARRNVQLREWPTIVKPCCESKKEFQELLGDYVEELISLSHLHYASNRYPLLLMFQGMDAAEGMKRSWRICR
jgi:hypothetical protein